MDKTHADKIDDIRQEALARFVRLHSGHATQHDHEQLAVWLSQSALHRAEFGKLDGLWSDMDALPSPSISAIPYHDTIRLDQRRPALSRRRFLLGGGAMAASAAGLAIVSDLPGLLLSDFTTGVGEIATFTLPDGSKAELDANSALSHDYTPARRSLVLRKGRALFDVAKDANRPFIVTAGSSRITALGTQFSVHHWDDRLTVTVTERQVSVGTPRTPAITLSKGQALSIDTNGKTSPVHQAKTTEALSWRTGKLIFEDRPLRQIIADLDRYRAGRIIVTDSALLDLHISGIFDTHDTDNALSVIDSILPVRVTRLTQYLTIIRPA